MIKNLSGKAFGKFQLGEYLGHTGTAHVYLSKFPGTEKQIVINLLPSHFTGELSFAEHFLVEASILATLDHPFIVKVHEFGIEQDYPFLVMQHVKGPTLKDLLTATKQRQVRIPLEVCIFIINSLGTALSHAHNQIIPHSDVKPHNVLLEGSTQVILTDFGFARLLNINKSSRQGTLEGHSPSKQFQEKSVEMRKDIFSLGIIFYQLTTGKLPGFEGDTSPLVENLNNVKVVSPQTIVPEIPDEMNQIILKAISNDEENRYHTVGELIEDLGKVHWHVKTTVLPSAQMSGVVEFSSRFSSVAMPDKYESKQESKVSLYFLDTGQIIDLDMGREYTLGRQYEGQPLLPDIDLTPYRAFEGGISKLHAKLEMGETDVKIIDLGSANGTWHAGKKIPVNTPYTLQHADLIMLGKLRIQILISGSVPTSPPKNKENEP
ncbi:MAG: protein kinase [Chloroflexi bacterium]|nr:protein kinase [Chloroflexota bacterium]